LFRAQSLAKEFKKRYLGLFEKAYLNNDLPLLGKTAIYKSQKEFKSLTELNRYAVVPALTYQSLLIYSSRFIFSALYLIIL